MKRATSTSGKAFERRVETILEQYRRQERADLEKVDPPVRIFKGRVIFQPNPWLDYSGAWTEQGGRSIHIEAKYTDEPRLPIMLKGVDEDQLDSLERWTKAGACCAVIWGHGDDMKLITAREIIHAKQAGARSMKWRHIPAVDPGLGFVTHDFLTELKNRLL